jgi:branched-chain amino acid transport system substrate-binding protein
MNKLTRVLPLLCVAAAGASTASAQAQELKIGFLAPRTGIITQLGTDMVNGFQMYLDEHNGMLGGAKVTFIVEDDKGTVDGDVSMAKKLILQDRVDMLVGAVLGTAAYALAPISTQEKTLFIGTITTGDDIAQRQSDKFPYTVFSTWVSSQPTHALGQWACEQGYKRVSAIGTDYAFGYEQVGGFQKAFEDCGGKVVQKMWVPFGTKDFGPYIPGIKSDIDAIFALMVGPMALQFPKQLRASGNKTIILGGSTNYDEFALPFMSDEVIADVSAHVYSAALQTPANEAFVKKYRAKYGKVPSYYSEANYATAMWIDQTLAKFKGKYPGPSEFIKAMATINRRPAARPRAARPRHQEPDPEHLHQEGRKEEDVRLRQGRALEHGGQDLQQRQHILAIRPGEVQSAAGLQPRFPALQILRLKAIEWDIPRCEDQGEGAGRSQMTTIVGKTLASIPIVDVRNGGPVRHATESRARARALRDECIRWLPRVAAGLLPAIDSVTRRWLVQSRSSYAGEVKAIAAELDFSGIWFLNGCYQWGLHRAPPANRTAQRWMARTLDWPFRASAVMPEIARMRGSAGRVLQRDGGYVGVLTASAPGRFAACINQAPMLRRTSRPWLRSYDMVLNARHTWGIRHVPPDHLLRDVFETCATFGEAKHRLETTPIARPVIYTLAGCHPGERCVIERTQDDFFSRTHDTCAANDWLLNMPRWEPRVAAEAFFTRTGEEAAENSRTRRDQLAVWPGVFGTEFDWVTPPVLNSQTRIAVEMCPASGVLGSWLQTA